MKKTKLKKGDKKMKEIETKQEEIDNQLFTPQFNDVEIFFVNSNLDKMDEIQELGTKLLDEVDGNEVLVGIIALETAELRTTQHIRLTLFAQIATFRSATSYMLGTLSKNV